MSGRLAALTPRLVKATTAEKFFVRFGVKYDVSSGTNGASAEVELQVAYDMCGQAVGTYDEQVVVTSDTKVFYALTPWLRSLHAAKMRRRSSSTAWAATSSGA